MNIKLFLFSIKNAFRRKSILLIALIGTGLGTALMATLVSLSNGMDAELTKTLNLVASDITVTSTDGGSFVSMFGGGTPIPASYADEISQIDHVKSIESSVSGTIPASAFDSGGIGQIGTPITGVDLEENRSNGGATTKIIQGEAIQDEYEIIVGNAVFERPNSAVELKIGDTIEVPIMQEVDISEFDAAQVITPGIAGSMGSQTPQNATITTTDDMETVIFTVVGIFETGNSFNDSGFIGSIDDVREITGMDDELVSSFKVIADDTENVEYVAETIESTFEDQEVPVQATMSKDVLGELNDTLDIFRTFILVISLVAAVAGGMSIFIIMLMSVIERLQEFGIFKATGWSNFNIVSSVIIESITVALLGSTVGLVVGYVVGQLMNQQLGQEIALFDIQLVGSIMLFGMVMGVLGGVIPAIKAARVSPIETLQSL